VITLVGGVKTALEVGCCLGFDDSLTRSMRARRFLNGHLRFANVRVKLDCHHDRFNDTTMVLLEPS
jgi:hypothetical protein